MAPPRLKVSTRLRDLMSYTKFTTPTPRILVLQSRYWLDDACLNAARVMGWEHESVPVAQAGYLPREQTERLLHSLTSFKPDFVLTINLSGMDIYGMFAALFEDLHIPFVTWFVDDPRTICAGDIGVANPWSVAFSWERAYLPFLKDLGFAHTEHLPLAVDHTVFNHGPEETSYIAPAFVGTSMVDAAQHEREWLTKKPALLAALDDAFSGGMVTRTNFSQGLSAMIGAEVVDTLDEDDARHAELYCFLEGTRRLRHDLISSLRGEDLTLHGDDGWRQLSVSSHGPVEYGAELASFYGRAAVNLNTTSIQMRSALNQRVFDCPASGGFLLTDAQADLASFFDVDSEVVSYTTNDECKDALRWFARRPEARREIVERAQKRVHAEHRYTHRLEYMAGVLKELFSG